MRIGNVEILRRGLGGGALGVRMEVRHEYVGELCCKLGSLRTCITNITNNGESKVRTIPQRTYGPRNKVQRDPK